ncbi:unnamed protein product [Rotaria sordida]|uniref:PiggyBac transposable element-derived protein domain-containing protein n=1 Tax=Rotaria sordida TaxID=392033 RepID=A0A818RNK0_9BILA|nr:unnamed protein product [Rotaria sordida]
MENKAKILADSASESEAEIEGDGEEEDNYEDMKVDEPEEISINFSASNRRTARNQNAPSPVWLTGNFKPHLFRFDSSESGLTQYLMNHQLQVPLDFFQFCFDQTLMDLIVTETNRYCLQNSKNTLPHAARWIDTTIDEMYVFLAATILMTHAKKP